MTTKTRITLVHIFEDSCVLRPDTETPFNHDDAAQCDTSIRHIDDATQNWPVTWGIDFWVPHGIILPSEKVLAIFRHPESYGDHEGRGIIPRTNRRHPIWDSWDVNPWILDVAQLITAEQAPQASGGDSKIYANVVSTAAFFLAGLSLFWQYRRSLLEAPNLAASGNYSITGLSSDPKNPKWAFNVAVANTGHRTASVKEVGWQIETGPTSLVAIMGDTEPAVPMRLEGLDSQDWEILVNIQGTHWKGLRGRPYAVVVARPTKREKKKGVGAERTIVGDWSTMDYDPEWLSTFMNP